MIARQAWTVLAAISIASVTHTASAEPRVDLAACTAFDRQALRAAIDRELPSDPRLKARDFSIIVECPDLATARLRVEPVFADGAIVRPIDLGEVPSNLRLKWIALVVAELIEVAAADTSGPAPISTSDGAGTASPHGSSVSGTGSPPQAGAQPPSTPQAMEVVHPQRVAELGTREPDVDTVGVRAGPRSERAPTGIAVTAGARFFSSTPTVLAQVGVEVALPWFRIGVRGALGDDSVSLGTLEPYVVTGTLARALACRTGATSLCAVARVEGGVAGVIARAHSMPTSQVTATNSMAPYGQASLAGELARTWATWSLVASLEVGWAEGYVAQTQPVNGGRSDVAALAGFVTIGTLGARWR
jgi:hypothetical protein